ncbi:MAG: phenylalanine--tRNA ligase subunit alpha [Christensenellales bacterium]|jgi:phenylalanyl-tRNA synthetase alpha chain
MKDKVNQLISEVKAQLSGADTLDEINKIKHKFLGKSGEFTALLKGLRDVKPELRPITGEIINQGKKESEALINDIEKKLINKIKQERLNSEFIDITLPGKGRQYGALHPLSIIKNEIIDVFTGLGFTVVEGPEIETDYYNFQAMNIPEDHPARDMQDTFYITDSILLRTHTSPMQARVMESNTPPIKIIVPGKVYRSDDDASHSPMFSQIEGLYVDKGVTICNLKAALDQIAKGIFNENTRTRLRPSYFPFTEPSVEADVECSICGGDGCRICKGTGWLEILGAGIVNPKVISNCGLDPEVYSGFAFGIGIERITMLKYGIPDMRILFENDIRMLKQYR